MKTTEDLKKSVPLELPVASCAELIANGACQVIDVREDQEWELCKIDGAIHIPMQQIPARLADIDPKTPAIVYCHHGMRSAQVVHWLRQNGYALAINLAGGIEQWSLQVDPTIVRY